MTRSALLRFAFFLGIAGAIAPLQAGARQAAFLSPNSPSMGAGDEAIKVEPKADIDVGETQLNLAKRQTVFFVNQTSSPIKIEKIALGSDSSVSADQIANDCEKQGTIAPSSRCSVEVSITPMGQGTWSVELLMTHSGAGRITRARLFGRTGSGSAEKSTGLSMSSKEVKPVDFGNVDIGSGKVVRSALMINDSPDAISVHAIDVIAADNGLERLEQGCAVNLELQPGASCPVTLLWEPRDGSPISTDLIIRHSGKLGFTVIPIRGVAKGGDGTRMALPKGALPLPMSAKELEKEVQRKIDPVSEKALSEGRSAQSGSASQPRSTDPEITLIGTVGTRAVFLLPNGQTLVVKQGDEFDTTVGFAKLMTVYASAADVKFGAKQVTLPLKAASSLVSMAVEQQSKQAAPAPAKSAPKEGSNK